MLHPTRDIHLDIVVTKFIFNFFVQINNEAASHISLKIKINPLVSLSYRVL